MWGWSNSGVWLCSTCRYAVLDFAMPYNLDKACPNCSELTRLRARIEELEHLSETYRLAHNDSEEQRVAQNLDLRDRAEKAEQRVAELETYRSECRENCMGGETEDGVREWVRKERLDKAEARVAELADLAGLVVRLHRQDGRKCGECGRNWPCGELKRAKAALEAAEGNQ